MIELKYKVAAGVFSLAAALTVIAGLALHSPGLCALATVIGFAGGWASARV